MDIDEIKTTWIKLNNKIDKLEVRNLQLERKVKEGRVKPYQEKNIRSMKVLIVVAFIVSVMVALFPTIFTVRTKIIYCVCMLWAILDCWYFVRQMKGFDFVMQSTQEIVERTYRIKKLFNRRQIIGIIFSIPVLMSLFYDMSQEQPFLLYAGIIGGIIGLIWGLFLQYNFKKRLRKIREEFEIEEE